MPAADDSRFAFGANWRRFLEVVDEYRIAAAKESLSSMLGTEDLAGKRFLDIGCGSGLFSLAAHRLGATVHSFDDDPHSVECTREISRRFGSDTGPKWAIERGSALDADYLDQLGTADVVYSWGVLHHTGEMWRAIDLVSRRVADSGRLWIAIYNDQGEVSRRWIQVKRLYQRLPGFLKTLLVVIVGIALLTHRICRAIMSGAIALLTGHNPFAATKALSRQVTTTDARGMSRWYDLVDWVGGWPFEVARPEEIIESLESCGFKLQKLKTVGGKMGCNEFVFERSDPRSP